jgi:hypothetical protein
MRKIVPPYTRVKSSKTNPEGKPAIHLAIPQSAFKGDELSLLLAAAGIAVLDDTLIAQKFRPTSSTTVGSVKPALKT